MGGIKFTLHAGRAQGITYKCPYCKEARPVTAATITLDKVIVEAECRDCRTVMAREFELSGRSINNLMTLSFIREGVR